MTEKTIHKILCQSKDYHTAERHVRHFFKQSMLLNYDTFTVAKHHSHPATADQFWPELEASIVSNREILASYTSELHESGCTDINAIQNIRAGYQSKLIHLIAHFVDGFIGIDSRFFSLPEDSHWLSELQKKSILHHPEQFWLLHIEADFDSIDPTALLHHLPPE